MGYSCLKQQKSDDWNYGQYSLVWITFPWDYYRPITTCSMLLCEMSVILNLMFLF
jgi:hypothetical protein